MERRATNEAVAPDSRARAIDVHAHFTLPSSPPHSHFGLWSEQVALGFMDAHGIDLQLLGISTPMKPDQARRLNDYVAGLVARYPTRFGLLANLPSANIDAALAELARASDELGADGFTLPSNVAGKYWGNPALSPILAELDRRGATVLLHPAVDAGKDFENLGRPRT
ncbi:amidohydrolase family protein [Aureimonas altamirensis]|uniref:amidohydrolase family protein n=1 Tax=Aureimonas altamirensis TaxID=370622 RepID=UPI0022B70E0D|nr:amidohydrolase family protein [Aureimonas altamirensis]